MGPEPQEQAPGASPPRPLSAGGAAAAAEGAAAGGTALAPAAEGAAGGGPSDGTAAPELAVEGGAAEGAAGCGPSDGTAAPEPAAEDGAAESAAASGTPSDGSAAPALAAEGAAAAGAAVGSTPSDGSAAPAPAAESAAAAGAAAGGISDEPAEGGAAATAPVAQNGVLCHEEGGGASGSSATGGPRSPVGAVGFQLPTSQSFLLRLVQGYGGRDCLGELGDPALEVQERARLTEAIQSRPPLEGAGSGAAGSVLAYFCSERGGDARTLRTIVDLLLRLAPPWDPVDLFSCLTVFLPRFAPVAMLQDAGPTLVRLCSLFEQLLLFHDPEVAILLRRANLGAEIYCAPWFLTAHASGLADPDAVLNVWDAWLARGESLDPIFLGLARLMLCHSELLLCGPGPELAQVLHASLGSLQHAKPQAIGGAMRRAAELKSLTPLTFLRQLQDGMLRPQRELEKPPLQEQQEHAGSAQPAEPTASKDAQAMRGSAAAARVARGAAWLTGKRGAAATPKPAEGAAGKPAVALTCMRVEPQDVMMMETVKARHLKRTQERAQSAGADGDAGPAECADDDTEGDGGCRLLPKLIDVRPLSEARQHGVKGAVGVNVAASAESVEEFIKWAQKRGEEAASRYGLHPVHILMTADGTLNADQRRFLTGVLLRGVQSVCLLSGGYEGLRPFFLQPVDGGDQRAPGERAQEAKELLQKGIGGLQSMWQRAQPAAQSLKQSLLDRVAPEGGQAADTPKGLAAFRPGGRDSGGARAQTPATFTRAALPPDATLSAPPAEGAPAAAPAPAAPGASAQAGRDFEELSDGI